MTIGKAPNLDNDLGDGIPIRPQVYFNPIPAVIIGLATQRVDLDRNQERFRSGAGVAGLARALFQRVGLDSYLGPRALVYPSLAILVTLVLWAALFRV